MFAGTDAAGGARFAFTDRHGGVSPAPWDALNLGDHVGDDPQRVAENRRRALAALGAEALVTVRQVHGAGVVRVDGPVAGEPPEADALVTATPGLALAVLVADCTPVLLADPVAGVVAAAHAGRRGLAAGVVPAALAAMAALGADPARVVARIGPAACGRCYEVPEAMRAEVSAVVPAAASTTRAGTAALDVPAGVAAQLAGVADVSALGLCTIESPDLYSYRREGTTGRGAGVVAWLP